jgi:hypothetical protein
MFYSIACHLLVLKEQRLPMDLQFLSKCNSTLTFSVRSKSNDSSNNSVKWTLFFPSTAKRKVISYLYELLEQILNWSPPSVLALPQRLLSAFPGATRASLYNPLDWEAPLLKTVTALPFSEE